MNIDKKFIVNLQGKEFILYNGLMDLAHQEGLISIDVELIQVPNEDNEMTAIAKATAKTKDKTFVDIGDASPKSVNRMIAPHIIRMASTRAKARALRDLTNVGMTALEELGGDEEDKTSNNTNNKYKTNVKGNTVSDKQVARLYAIASSASIDADTVKDQVKRKYNKEISDLTKTEYDTVCKGYEGLKK